MMRTPLSLSVAVLALAVAGVGCVSKSRSKREATIAFQQGQLQQQQQPSLSPEQLRSAIFFRGPVRTAAVLWHPQMTLSQAIVAAEYLAQREPRSIMVTRNGKPVFVDVKRLLRGVDNWEVFPGDVVEIR